MRAKFFILFGLALLLSSCDCWIEVNGKVISSSTNEPINGAKIEMVGKKLNSTSDKFGKFTISEMTGFCYDPKIKVTYKGFKTFFIELESESGFQNYKLKKDPEFVQFEEPYYPNPKNINTFVTGTWIEKYSVNFKIESDSIIIYLDEENLSKEINLIKENLKNINSG